MCCKRNSDIICECYHIQISNLTSAIIALLIAQNYKISKTLEWPIKSYCDEYPEGRDVGSCIVHWTTHGVCPTARLVEGISVAAGL
jgi:hypothetical protein